MPTPSYIAPALPTLTAREREVLDLIGNCKSSKEIAVILRLSVDTIGGYRKAICKKLNVHSTPSLAIYTRDLR